MSKPFSIQSPENIAKEYGGNKQKIAEAMQMGIVDATAGVLAGMFIDRMRSAQVQEGMPQATVAQQVMGGVQAAPPGVSSSPAPGGLGATMQAAPPMTPPQIGAPEEAPMVMAEGGLAGLSVPDSMFDEPDEGGYAGGGLVAFAEGGRTRPDYDALVDWLYPRIEQVESGGRPRPGQPTKYGTAQGVAQMLPDTAKGVAERLGVPYSFELLSGTSPEAIKYQRKLGRAYVREGLEKSGGDAKRAAMFYHGGPDTSIHGPKTRAYASKVLGGDDPSALPERDVSTAAGRMGSFEDMLAAVQGINRKSDEEVAAEGKLRERLTEQASDEYYEKQRKSDMWQTLAEIGFNMASSNSPYILQAIGEAAVASLPGARADKKQRKETKDRALEGLMELSGGDRKQAMEALKIAIPLYQDGIRAEQFEKEYGLRERELEQREDIEKRRLDIEEYRAKHPNMSDLESGVNYFMEEDPKMTRTQALEAYLKLKQQYAPKVGGAALTAEEIRKQTGATPTGTNPYAGFTAEPVG